MPHVIKRFHFNTHFNNFYFFGVKVCYMGPMWKILQGHCRNLRKRKNQYCIVAIKSPFPSLTTLPKHCILYRHYAYLRYLITIRSLNLRIDPSFHVHNSQTNFTIPKVNSFCKKSISMYKLACQENFGR